VLGAASEPLGGIGLSHLLPAGLLFALPLSVHGGLHALRWLVHLLPRFWLRAGCLASLLLGMGYFGHAQMTAFTAHCLGTKPLAIGLDADQHSLVSLLKEQTTADARILWEERSGGRTDSHWSALLSLWTDRAYLGGLDSEVAIEHNYATFRDQLLAGRPLVNWTDHELEEFCRRYNIGWVVCWSPAALERFQKWTGSAPTASFHQQGTGYLFTLRSPHSYTLKGRARWLRADAQRIALTDIVPDDEGKVVLSLHHQAGMRAAPARVQIEREVDPHDPIPFVRLRVPGPVARVTITWEGR